MSDLKQLYQELILDHSKKPRNLRRIADADLLAHGHNPLCGDKLTIYLKLADGAVADVAFEGSGCAICMSSASLMTQALKGKSEAEADALFEKFHQLLTEEVTPSDQAGLDLGKLNALAGVKEFPIRVKCATLPWHTFHAALHGERETVKTE